MSECTNLETLPSGINLQSLGNLCLNGCSKLKSFPDISRNVFILSLSNTAIEEIPWWVENFYKLKFLLIDSCSKLKYVSISALKYLCTIEFSNCGALVGARWKTDKSDNELPVAEQASSSLSDHFVPKAKFKLLKCFDLDLKALLQQQSVFEQLILSCEEVPLYFTHKATGTPSSLTIPLLQTSLSQPYFRLRVCAVIVFGPIPAHKGVQGDIKINCRFKDRLGNHFDSPDQQVNILPFKKGSHLFIFDYYFPLKEDIAHLARLNYDHVDIQFRLDPNFRDSCKLKEWGIRLVEENQLGDTNTLSHVFEADEDSEELETSDSTLSSDHSNVFKDVGDEVNQSNRDNETKEEHGRTSKQIIIEQYDMLSRHWS